jgi:tRNA threonylcarbamoyladenosine biosynthesis protein TsaE
MLDVVSHSEEVTLAHAAAFAARLKAGDAVALRGSLGAGKTLFSRGVARALGYDGPVSSPSYALVHEYPARFPVYHMDLYRLAPGADWEEIGLAHYLDGHGVCLVEWPERLPEGWSPFTYDVTLEAVGETDRKIQIVAIQSESGAGARP